MDQQHLMGMVGDIATVKTQNEEIIRRLNQQNGRVDKLELMQWRIVAVIAGTVGGIEVISKFFV